MSDVAIKIEGLSKQYRLGNVGTGTLTSDLQRWWAKARGKEDPTLQIGMENKLSEKGGDYVYALRDINLEVKQGDILGVIGKNGAGKSTLLKILSKVTTPTTGTIDMYGRVASLLEVGTGFHPELTGRENIFLNGAIMGMTKQEIKSKFDEIVDFSGVEKYIDTPVKRYSSGMYVRLAFGVAAHLEPEILIVDEVLAVGDADFQKKAIGKMQDVSRNQGRTVLFVSHNLTAVKTLCNKGIVLANGTVVFDGNVENAITAYQREFLFNKNKLTGENPANENIELTGIEISPKNGNLITVDSGILFTTKFINCKEGINLDITFELSNFEELVIFHTGKLITTNKDSKKGEYEIKFEVPPFYLNAGEYKLKLIFGESQRYVLFEIDNLINFQIEDIAAGNNMNKLPGLLKPNFDYNISFNE